MDLAQQLARVTTLFARDLDAERVTAIDDARSAGATWQQLADAVGAEDRRYVQTWRARRRPVQR
jgi:hypothetical protein